MNCIECGQTMEEKKVINGKFNMSSIYRYTCPCGFTTSKSKNTKEFELKIDPYGYCTHAHTLNDVCMSCGKDLENIKL